MGLFIAYLKVQPFIATLAGMWLARGLCYLISDSEIRIYNPLYKLLAGTRILIPGLADPVTKTGDYITILVVVALLVLVVGMYLAHYTQFGRTIYAMGGNNGTNEQSARLMGLRVDRTKVQVYMLSGFCSALAGIAYSIYVGSGHGTHATGMELTVIAAVVIGGMRADRWRGLPRRGPVRGADHGPHPEPHPVQRPAQLLVDEHRHRCADACLHRRPERAVHDERPPTGRGATRQHGGAARRSASAGPSLARRRFLVGAAVVVVIVLAGAQIIGAAGRGQRAWRREPRRGCQLKPNRQERAAELMKGGAAIAYERNGGSACVDELYAIYPDGRIVGGQRHADGREEGVARRRRGAAREHQRPRLVHRQHVHDHRTRSVRPVLLVLHDRVVPGARQDHRRRGRGDGCPGQLLAHDGQVVHAPSRVQSCLAHEPRDCRP